MLSNSGEEVPISIHSNIFPPNVLFPCRILIPNFEETEKDVVEVLPEIQGDIPILGAPKQVPEPCAPRKMIQDIKVARKCVENIKEAVQTTKAQEIEFDDTGQATTIIINLAKFKIPKISKNVVFVINFESEKDSKPSSPILIFILFYTNVFLILMIRAPALEIQPLPEHFKYHCPFKDKPVHLNKGREA